MSGSTTKAREPKEMQHHLICETGGEAERVSRIASGAAGDGAWCVCGAKGARSWRGRKGTGCAKSTGPRGAAESNRAGATRSEGRARPGATIAPCGVTAL